MTEAEARARLERMVQASEAPALTTAEVDDLVALAARPDIAGLLRGVTGWIPTWDLTAAVAEGWRWKAAKAARDYDFSADGQTFARSQQRQAFLEMAGQYTDRRIRSVRMRS